jgi:hypothetical protein
MIAGRKEIKEKLCCYMNPESRKTEIPRRTSYQ